MRFLITVPHDATEDSWRNVTDIRRGIYAAGRDQTVTVIASNTPRTESDLNRPGNEDHPFIKNLKKLDDEEVVLLDVHSTENVVPGNPHVLLLTDKIEPNGFERCVAERVVERGIEVATEGRSDINYITEQSKAKNNLLIEFTRYGGDTGAIEVGRAAAECSKNVRP